MNWLLIIITIIVQEVISLNTLIFEIHHNHFHIWLIHIIFIVATVFDIIIGYILGKYFRKKLTPGKISAFAEKWSERFNAYVGKKGRWFALLLIGNFSFPYVNAFIASWLDMPFIESFIFIFLGNMIFYISLWALVLGVTKVIPNLWMAFGVIIGVTVLVMLIIRRFKIRKV